MANLANCVYRWPLLVQSSVVFMAFILVLGGQNQVLAQSNQSGCECLQGPKCSSDDILDPNCQRISRSDCPCCIVCASGEGQTCDGLIRPCDPTLGLFCNRTSNVCERGKRIIVYFILFLFYQGRKKDSNIRSTSNTHSEVKFEKKCKLGKP